MNTLTPYGGLKHPTGQKYRFPPASEALPHFFGFYFLFFILQRLHYRNYLQGCVYLHLWYNRYHNPVSVRKARKILPIDINLVTKILTRQWCSLAHPDFL